MELNSYSGAGIPWREEEKIRHEVNTFYSKYINKPMIWHRSVGMDKKYYIYVIENYSFDNYRFVARIIDQSDEV